MILNPVEPWLSYGMQYYRGSLLPLIGYSYVPYDSGTYCKYLYAFALSCKKILARRTYVYSSGGFYGPGGISYTTIFHWDNNIISCTYIYLWPLSLSMQLRYWFRIIIHTFPRNFLLYSAWFLNLKAENSLPRTEAWISEIWIVLKVFQQNLISTAEPRLSILEWNKNMIYTWFVAIKSNIDTFFLWQDNKYLPEGLLSSKSAVTLFLGRILNCIC